MTGRVHKVIGTETEFGIVVSGRPDFNPIVASALLVEAYSSACLVRWASDEEMPANRGTGDLQPGGPGSLNVALTNGARLYVDHAHPEYSTPECFDPLEAAMHDKAGEVVIARAAGLAAARLGGGERLLVFKNNSDGKGNSYGSHENYLLPRSLGLAEIARHLSGFLVTRQIFTGAGKVGAENGRPLVPFQISQRADFFEQRVGLETTIKRPIINTRDEPHADPSRYRRLHVIAGDANLSETQTFLKLGTTALVLSALEQGGLGDPLVLEDPVKAIWQVSHDPDLRQVVALARGATATACELQWDYLARCTRWSQREGVEPIYRKVLEGWEESLRLLEADPRSAADRLDWVAKMLVLEAYRERHHLAPGQPALRMVDLQYHDVDPRRGWYHRLVASGRMRRLFTDTQIARAVTEAPARTRAYLRGRCAAKYPGSLAAVNWSSLLFDTGEGALKRVPMMEPLHGDRQHMARVIDESASAADFIQALGGA